MKPQDQQILEDILADLEDIRHDIDAIQDDDLRVGLTGFIEENRGRLNLLILRRQDRPERPFAPACLGEKVVA